MNIECGVEFLCQCDVFCCVGKLLNRFCRALCNPPTSNRRDKNADQSSGSEPLTDARLGAFNIADVFGEL